MKTISASALYIFFISISLFNSLAINSQEKDNTIVATFVELTDADYYKFTDEKNNTLLFYDMTEDVEISLYDEEYIGKKFTIVWKEITISMFDDDGEETGETKKVKRIISLKEEE